MTKAITIFSCANDLHKIAIVRWRIGGVRGRVRGRVCGLPRRRAAALFLRISVFLCLFVELGRLEKAHFRKPVHRPHGPRPGPAALFPISGTGVSVCVVGRAPIPHPASTPVCCAAAEFSTLPPALWHGVYFYPGQGIMGRRAGDHGPGRQNLFSRPGGLPGGKLSKYPESSI